MIRVVFFDVGGTLLKPYPSVGGIYSKVAERHGVKRNDQDLDQRFRVAWKNQKKLNPFIDEAWWQTVVFNVFAGSVFSNFEVFFKDLYAAFEDPQAWTIFDDVLPTFKQLQARGIRLAVASNWDARLPALLTRLGLSPYFEKQYVSFYTGVAKPDPDFFRQPLEEMKISPLEALHVGDEETDMLSAEAAGIRAYMINRDKKPINARMLVSLEEILARI
jgi:putative hydrolase of the HAD superfamily